MKVIYVVLLTGILSGCASGNVDSPQVKNSKLFKKHCIRYLTLEEFEKDITELFSKTEHTREEIDHYIGTMKYKYQLKKGDTICKYIYGSFEHMMGRMGYAVFKKDLLVYNMLVMMN